MEKLKPLGLPTTTKVVGVQPEAMDATALIVDGLRTATTSGEPHVVFCQEVQVVWNDGELTAVGSTAKLFGNGRFPVTGAFLYTIFSVPDGLIYIGSTTNLMRRLSTHRSGMLKGSHRNRNINETFIRSQSHNWEVMFLDFGSTKEGILRDVEQSFLDAAKKVNHLRVLNTSEDTHLFGKGLVRDQEFREAVRMRKQKKVRCAGMVYPSLKEAARVLKMVPSQIHRRLNSSNPQFADWGYVTEDAHELRT